MKRLQSQVEFLLFFLFLVTLFSGCSTAQRLDTSGVYYGRSELFVMDSAFDLAHSTLDTAFKYEKSNRQALWQISPKIKHSMDKLRIEAIQVEKDYSLGRSIYQTNAVAGSATMNSAIGKLQAASIASLTIIQTKGNP